MRQTLDERALVDVESVCALMLRVMSSLTSRMPLRRTAHRALGMAEHQVLARVGVRADVRLEVAPRERRDCEAAVHDDAVRLFVALVLVDAKYGLSTSVAAESPVMRARVPAGVSQFAALFVSGHASRPMSGLSSPLYALSLLA